MDAVRMHKLGAKPLGEADRKRAEATDVANDFEQLFVRTLVSTMRSSASLDGSGGMFGSGPGADTYADWFDQNVADQVARGGRVGIASTILGDLERHGQLTATPTPKEVAAYRPLHETPQLKGGIDVRH